MTYRGKNKGSKEDVKSVEHGVYKFWPTGGKKKGPFIWVRGKKGKRPVFVPPGMNPKTVA